MVTTAEAPNFRELARLLVDEAAKVTELAEGSSEPPIEPAHSSPVAALDETEVITHRLEDLPKELGVLLASVGALGFVLPGIAGAPALLAGGLVLWPKTFGKVETWFEGRFPIAHRKSMQQVDRFLDDLGRRYPISE